MVTLEEEPIEVQGKQLLFNELRQETNTTFQEIGQLKKSIEYLIAEFELHRSLSKKTKNGIDTFSERIIDLEGIFKQVRVLSARNNCTILHTDARIMFDHTQTFSIIYVIYSLSISSSRK